MQPKYWAIIILAAVAIGASTIYYEKQPATYVEPVVVHHDPKPTPTPQPSMASSTTESMAGWQTYSNSQYGFSFEYPDYIKVGDVAPNSVLGTADVAVSGIYVGELVFVPLNTATKIKLGDDYFKNYFSLATSPSSTEATDGPSPVGCDQIVVPKSQQEINLINCMGEGGAAEYGEINGNGIKIFIDSYSKGWANIDTTYLGDIKSQDLLQLLSTFKFTN